MRQDDKGAFALAPLSLQLLPIERAALKQKAREAAAG